MQQAAPLMPAVPDPDATTPEQREEDEQVGFIYRLRLRGLDESRIADACRTRFGIGKTRVRRLFTKVLEGWKEQVEMGRQFTRPEQIMRLRASIANLSGALAEEQARTKEVARANGQTETVSATEPGIVAKLTDALVKVERLLAEVEGNRVPDELVVHAEIRQAAQVVFASLTPERARELLERARDRKRLAMAATETT